MAVETFLNTLFEELLVSEGTSPVEAEQVREHLSFIDMVKKEFPYKARREVGSD